MKEYGLPKYNIIQSLQLSNHTSSFRASCKALMESRGGNFAWLCEWQDSHVSHKNSLHDSYETGPGQRSNLIAPGRTLPSKWQNKDKDNKWEKKTYNIIRVLRWDGGKWRLWVEMWFIPCQHLQKNVGVWWVERLRSTIEGWALRSPSACVFSEVWPPKVAILLFDDTLQNSET